MNKRKLALSVVIGVSIGAVIIAGIVISTVLVPPSKGRTGMLRILLTDRPAELERLDISISSLSVHKFGDDEGLWIAVSLLLESDELFNLLEFQDGRTMPLAKEAISTGNYNKIRMFIGSAFATFEGEETVPRQLDVPSEHIEVTIDFTIEPAATTTLLVDVEAEWISISASNRLRPIVKASVIEDAQTG